MPRLSNKNMLKLEFHQMITACNNHRRSFLPPSMDAQNGREWKVCSISNSCQSFSQFGDLPSAFQVYQWYRSSLTPLELDVYHRLPQKDRSLFACRLLPCQLIPTLEHLNINRWSVTRCHSVWFQGKCHLHGPKRKPLKFKPALLLFVLLNVGRVATR